MSYFPQFTNISYAHAKAHAALMWNASYIHASLASAATLVVWVHSLATMEAHVNFGIDGSDDFEWRLFRSVSGYSAGTPLTVSANKDGGGPPELTIVHTPTGSPTQTLAREVATFGSAVFGNPAGDGAPVRGGTEFIMIPGMEYAVEVLNTSGGPIKVGFEMGWYEETP